MPKPLPIVKQHLLKGQPWDLQQGAAAGAVDAMAILRAYSYASELDLQKKISVRTAQKIIAAEYGYDTWSALQKAYKQHPAIPNRVVDRFFEAVIDYRKDVSIFRAMFNEEPDFRRMIDLPLFGLGDTALAHAAWTSNLELIELLIDNGADPNLKNDFWAGGYFPLDKIRPRYSWGDAAGCLLDRGAVLHVHAAAQLGRIDDVRRLISENPDLVNERGCGGQTPLHLASTVEICELLLDNGADIEMRDIEHNSTPVQLAFDNIGKLRYLIDRGAKPDIYSSCILGDFELAEKVLNEKPNALKSRPGHGEFAAAGRHAYVFHLGRPLSVARLKGHRDLANRLLEMADLKTQLIYHCEFGDEAEARAIVRRSPKIVSKLAKHQMETIVECAFRRKLDSVKLMIDLGFDLEVSTVHGTPLSAAAARGAPDLVELLLDSGASRSSLDYAKRTPFQVCIDSSRWSNPNHSDYVSCIEAFINAGEPVPAIADGDTPVVLYLRRLGAM